MEDNEQVWDEAERNFWIRFRRQGELESAELQAAYEKAVEEVKIEAKTLEAKRLQAVRARDGLRQQLKAAEQELSQIDARCDQNADMMKDLEDDFRENEEDRLERRESVKRQMTRWFLRKRGHQVPSDTEDENDRPDRLMKKMPVKRAVGKRPRKVSPQPSPERPAKRSRGGTTAEDLDDDSGNEANEIRERRSLKPTRVSRQKPAEKESALEPETETAWAVPVGEALTVIKDADGNVIGPLKRIETWNQWHEVLQQLPIKRSVSVRRRRRFGRADLESIYKRMEKKGLKWLACMIQATGEIRDEPCAGCKRGLGPFTDCIFIRDELFPKCGNCQWGRQGCYDATDSEDDDVEDQSQPNENQSAGEQAQIVNSANLNITTLGVRKEHDQESDEKSDKENDNQSDEEGDREREPEGKRERQKSLEQRREPGPERGSEQERGQAMLPAQPAQAQVTETDADIDTASHPLTSSPLTSLADDMSSPQWPLFEGTDDVNLTPITRENLVLKHNGTVYTFPEIVDGVPVEKIDEDHPYWDPTWQDVKSSIQRSLDRWVEKLEESKKLRESGGEIAQSQRWNTGRQVNRGLKILDFLDKGEISPYQLLGKRFTVSGKGSITAYDTLFRLCETLSELEKFRLDVRPLEWMRHRLYEIWLEQGKSINLCKVIRHFYNDPKLAALRADAGFKNIGRPSGTGKADCPGAVAGLPLMDSPCRQPERRKSPDTPLVTPLAKRPRLSLEIPSPSKTPTHIIEPSVENAAHDDIEPSEDDKTEDDGGSPSDTDTYSGGTINKDDFRVYQVKSRLYTSSPKVTQYLHWLRGKGQFEHQVLTCVKPVHWGYLKHPIDFGIDIKDITGVSFNPDAMLVELALSENSRRVFKKDGLPQGNIMVAFKRVSTLKRFVICLRDLSVPATNLPEQVIRERWASMKSEQLPDTDAEASDEFRN
ncbi:hypothetical protein ESCO_004513 [Escovopsis weberi]|uniref:Uncharacterized protein n=1 Tax=Escovopsis weberi TaxID=150374 RepID=A0A0M8N6U1_ESCWE|nr:hypothetical protein ESCO_004513 [Escovopsis weberi]